MILFMIPQKFPGAQQDQGHSRVTWAEKLLRAGQQLLGRTFAWKMSSLFNLILWKIIIEIACVVRGSKQIWHLIWIKQICSLVWINFLLNSFASSHNRGNFYYYFHSIELNNDDIFKQKSRLVAAVRPWVVSQLMWGIPTCSRRSLSINPIF